MSGPEGAPPLDPVAALAVRGTALAAVALWTAHVAAGTGAPARSRRARMARALSTAGLALYLTHVVCAFGLVHHWSHAAAWRHVARTTRAAVGIETGVGLLADHAFTLGWVSATLAVWCAPGRGGRGAAKLRAAWHGFAGVMVFFSTAVFGSGVVRVAGVGLTLVLVAAAAARLARGRAQSGKPGP